MNIEKAIETLKMENELMQFGPNTGEDYPIELQNQDNQDLYNANLVAIEALEKQISKKTIYYADTNDEYEHYKCPGCKEVFYWSTFYMKDKHCNNCGQKLDWEVEDE